MSAFELQLPSVWQRLRDVQALVLDAMIAHPEQLRTASLMVASELAENAIKYGEVLADCPNVTFGLVIEATSITIRVASGITPGPALDAVRKRIDTLNAAPSKQDLYYQRLRELLEQPTATGQLGLLRVAFEGQFDLSYTYQAPILTITARREIP